MNQDTYKDKQLEGRDLREPDFSEFYKDDDAYQEFCDKRDEELRKDLNKEKASCNRFWLHKGE